MKHEHLDPAARPATGDDIPHVKELFRLNYPVFYPHPELYGDAWLGRALSDEGIELWVIDEGGVVAAGAVILDYGDYDNGVGLLGGVVAHPERAGAGIERGLGFLGYRMIKTLAYLAERRAACLISEARTKHRLSQRFLEHAELRAVGLLPHYNLVDDRHESLVLYADLYGDAPALRTEKRPRVIRSAAPLARHVLSSMDFPASVDVEDDDCPPRPAELACELREAGGLSLKRLREIDGEREGGPAVFDSVSLDYGMPLVEPERVRYFAAVVNEETVGAAGYRVDATSGILKVTDLVFNREGVADFLCAAVVDIAAREKMRLIEADLSAYDAGVQQTFFGRGFRPAGYVPAMAAHDGRRLDVLKMIRLETPYDSSGVRLYEQARDVVPLVEKGFSSARG